ncbi:MAG: PAS domain-containing sensor histidine kinase [Burkholderiales bacterium]|nr:PAS domain-containing sensor histidine kinase [Burkholderiales bacterium]
MTQPTDHIPANYGELNTVASLVRCGVLIVGSDTQLRFASPNACELLDYSSADAVKTDWPEVASQLNLSQLQSLKTGHGPWRFKVDYWHAGTSRLLRVEAYRLEQENGPSYLLLMKDRMSLDSLNRQLVTASQMAIQGYLTNALVHDLNAPINNIQLTLELLQSGLKELDGAALPAGAFHRLERYQSVLKEETQRLKLLIRALPKSFNPASSLTEKFDLRPILEDLSGHLRHEAAAKQIRRSISVPAQELAMIGSPGHIKLALHIVGLFLLEATATGGTLMIRAERRGSTAEIALCTDAARLVKGSISGLDDIFFSSEDDALGLYAARVIIESQGGDITFEEQADRIGFRAGLPIAAANPSPSAVHP